MTVTSLPAQAIAPTVVAPITSTGLSSACPALSRDQELDFSTHGITSADNDKTLVVHQTDRFSVFLDDREYPLGELQTGPAGMLGTVSNGSLRGPNCYPIMFEALGEGEASLHDRDFKLKVLVENNAPRSPIPLP